LSVCHKSEFYKDGYAVRLPKDTSFLTPKISVKFQRAHPQPQAPSGAPNGGGVDYNSDFRPISCYISETVQDTDVVVMKRWQELVYARLD